MDEKQYLRDVIGIEPIKNQLIFHIKNFETTGIFRNLLLVGSKGNGKSLLARAIARHLTEGKSNRIRKFIELNCAAIPTLNDFINVISEHLIDCEGTIYFDEAEELSKEVGIALLTILNINEEKKNTFTYNGEEYLFDFREISFIFSTTNPEKLLAPLVDRLELVNLPTYKVSELSGIISKNLGNIKFSPEVLENLSHVARGNPRSCVKLTDNIKDYLKRINKNYLSIDDCKEIYKQLSVFPLGLNQSEIQILETLKSNPNCSLSRLAAILGGSVQMIRRFDETYLLKCGLLEISGARGRNLTSRGITYLKKLQELELTTHN
jgi:Holliday junction resolvasome RuvABC ATP-dependent DNA helicase subunit